MDGGRNQGSKTSLVQRFGDIANIRLPFRVAPPDYGALIIVAWQPHLHALEPSPHCGFGTMLTGLCRSRWLLRACDDAGKDSARI